MSVIAKALLMSIGSKLLVGGLVVEYELVAACLGDVFAKRGFEVRAGLRCGADANNLVLACVANGDGAAAEVLGETVELPRELS